MIINKNEKKIVLKIDGKAYSGNHILLEEGESFSVNYDNIKDYLKPLE